MKELEGLGTKAIDQPIVILHPVLLVTQQPVVNRYQLGGEMMRLFDGADDANRVRFALHKTLNAGHDRRGRGTMATSGIGRDDEDFRIVGFHRASETKPSGCSSICFSKPRAAFFISRSSFLIRTRCFGLKGNEG